MGLPSGLSSSVSPSKPYIHLSSPPYVLHAPPISFLSIRSAEQYWVRCGRSPVEIVGSNPTGGHGYLSVVSVVCCQAEVSATS